MLAYILLVGIPIVYMGILQGIKSTYRLEEVPYKRTVLNVFFFIFFLLLALRAETIGVDTANYLSKFDYSLKVSWGEWMASRTSEYGFAILTKLIGFFTKSKQLYMAIIAGLILIPVAYLYNRESEGPLLTMCLFLILPLFGMFFTGFRQSIAIAMTVPAYYCVRDRKKIRFVLIVLAAMLFHQSAFIMLLLYPVYYMRLTRKNLIWLVPLLVLFYLFSDRIFLLISNLLISLYEGRYFEMEATGAYVMLLLFILLLVFSYIFIDEEDADADIIGLRNILVLSVMLQTFTTVSTLAMRMNYYFLLFLPLLIPKVIWRAKGKNALTCQIANAIMCVYFLYYFLDKAFHAQTTFGIFPYIPFWEA